ncbi:T9SS type A sorting domain-containing protein [Tenacibaculum sp. 190524A05c]|uniref:Secretion system C-terminal sorting domain-containing protein n=1 Tax=Tenacibaculum platacis TaxID=3137852 RepID=A0ABM9NQP0_9FLAO
MKHYYKIVLTLTLSLFLGFSSWGQLTTGDIAFLGYNADAPDAFSIVALVDIPSSSTIYFTDNESDGAGGINSGEGTLSWNTGGSVIAAGTVVTFTDLNATRTASVGTLSVDNGTLNIAGGGDAIFAFIGTNGTTPTTFLAGIQNETGNFGNLAGTGLTEGTTFVNFFMSGSPDGGQYNGPRTGLGSFSAYLTEIGDNTNWTVSDADGTLILPLNATSFEVTPTWTGTTDNDWATGTNWSTGSVPGATDNVIIPSGLTNYPTISSAVTVNTMSIASGASLIANATVTGDVTYTRSLGTTNWYLVSSPVSGEDMTDMRANNSFKTNGSSEISFAPYDNSQSVANDRWAYFSNTATDALVNGKGYSASLSAAGNISFTGSINSGDVMIALTQGGGSGTNFNLLGNPYTAFVNSATFLTAESGDLASETIWLWNQATSSYETKVTADAFKIAPGQGFFVEANSTNNVSFTGAMQSHEASDTFQRSSRPEVQLYVNDGSNSRYAKLYYINGTTTGFDNGYDGKLFNGLTNSFAVYTHLLSDSQGDNYQVQSLPTSDIETMVVPVGLIADSNKEITFSVNTKNLPQGVNVYLEDRLNNTFVNLSEDDHTITTKSAVNGIGQYYLHTTSARLSNDDIAQDIANVSIYRSANNEITVAGLQSEANVKVFSLLGEELVNTDINSNGLSKIALPNLSTGVYVVKLNSVLGNITKKIILE